MKNSLHNTITILGTRGSVPTFGKEYLRYGGSTTCVLARLGGEYLVLDAGTGLMNLPENLPDEKELPILLSHMHLDHLLGIGVCPLLSQTGRKLVVYAADRDGDDAEARIAKAFSPPLWPISLRDYPAAVRFAPVLREFRIGSVTVETAEGEHPGGVTIFKLTGAGKRVVFITDCTLTKDLFPKLVSFAEGCDLLLCDGQYSAGEWERYASYGHSTWTMAAELGIACRAKQIRIIHHSPKHTDDELLRAETALKEKYPQCAFAREREEICL